MNPLSIKVELTVLKPISDVFAAVRKPIPFFVAKATEALVEGKTVEWTFPEFTMQVPVKVLQVIPNSLIRFEWGRPGGGANTCEFRFAKPQIHNPEAKPEQHATTVSVTETGWSDDAEGRAAANGNTFGWSHMVCALKAYLEHGVNLRHGAFLHRKF